MDIRVLKYFLAIAQEENVTKAAELLHTTQPNISRQIAELEEELGKQLFVKNGRRFVLTEEGVFLRKRAKEIVELTERTEADIAAYDRLASGVVHIGAAETYAMRLLADAMIELKKLSVRVLRYFQRQYGRGHGTAGQGAARFRRTRRARRSDEL